MLGLIKCLISCVIHIKQYKLVASRLNVSNKKSIPNSKYIKLNSNI